MDKSLSINIIDKYIDYISNEKRMSCNTIMSYKRDIGGFLSYIKETYDKDSLHEVTSEIVRGWIAEMMDKQTARATINRKLSCIKSLFNYAMKMGEIEDNPSKDITGIKREKKIPSFLTEKELSTLLNDIEYSKGFEGYRERITNIMLSGTGIRRAELISLKLTSIDYDNREIKVLGKRDKERIIPINTYIISELRSYIVEREKYLTKSQQDKEDEGWLIISNKGEKSYPELIYRIVTNTIDKVTSREKKSPHILRHTFATLLLNKGADINSVKELLGHESLAATQIYTHNTIEKIKKTYNSAHPRA